MMTEDANLNFQLRSMPDDDLLAQINAHDPYDVEFARRFRALAAERDALRKRAEEAEKSDAESVAMYQRARERAERMKAELARVALAAQAVLRRWDSTDWKAPPTADVMNDLRAALRQVEGGDE